MSGCQSEEVLIHAIASDLVKRQHVAVGASSPIPASAALLAKAKNPDLQVSLLGSEKHSSFTDGGRELFDCAAQGRIDTFFLSGVQIDGQANINLVGIGDYPTLKKRFAGSFGSAYLYDLVPNVILFCWAHSRSTLVDAVDFISAAGPRQNSRFRPGGPTWFITDLCVFEYRAELGGFRLVSLHPGVTLEQIHDNTAFAFEVSERLITTTEPDPDTLVLLRTTVSQQMLDVYPVFAQRLWTDASEVPQGS